MDDFANNDQSPDSIEQERDMEELFCSSVYRRLCFFKKNVQDFEKCISEL